MNGSLIVHEVYVSVLADDWLRKLVEVMCELYSPLTLTRPLSTPVLNIHHEYELERVA